MTNSLAGVLIGPVGEYAAPAVVTAVVTGTAAVAAACDAAVVVTAARVFVASSCEATVVVGAAVAALLAVSVVHIVVALTAVVEFSSRYALWDYAAASHVAVPLSWHDGLHLKLLPRVVILHVYASRALT